MHAHVHSLNSTTRTTNATSSRTRNRVSYYSERVCKNESGVICCSLGVVTCRSSSKSFHSDQVTPGLESIPNEVVHARNWRISPRRRGIAYINEPRQSALLHRNAHTVLLQL